MVRNSVRNVNCPSERTVAERPNAGLQARRVAGARYERGGYPANDKAQLAVNGQAIGRKRRLLRSATPFHGGARGCGRVNGKSQAVT